MSEIIKDIESPVLTTGGVFTAVWDFLQGDALHVTLGLLISISVLVINIIKIKKQLTDDDEED